MLLNLVENPQEINQAKDFDFYGEWQVLTLVNLYFQELKRGKISKHLIVGILKSKALSIGIVKELLDTFEQIIISEDLIISLKM